MIVYQTAASRLNPDALFISVEDAKKHCNISTSDDDLLIEGYIKAATRLAEDRTGRYFLPTKVTGIVQDWSTPSVYGITVSPFRTARKLIYKDETGAELVLDPTLWSMEELNDNVWLNMRNSGLPGGTAVTVTFEAGFDDMAESGAGDLGNLVPDEMDYHLVRLIVDHMYQNRGIARIGTLVAELPFAAQAIIDMRRIYR